MRRFRHLDSGRQTACFPLSPGNHRVLFTANHTHSGTWLFLLTTAARHVCLPILSPGGQLWRNDDVYSRDAPCTTGWLSARSSMGQHRRRWPTLDPVLDRVMSPHASLKKCRNPVQCILLTGYFRERSVLCESSYFVTFCREQHDATRDKFTTRITFFLKHT